MTIVLALLGAIAGAVVGGFVGFFAIIGLGLVTGADNQQGALAMGAAVVGLPVGAVIGMVAGALLVIRQRARSKPAQPLAKDAAPEEDGQGIGKQGWIALGVVAILATGFWTWFNWSGDPPQFRGSSRPVLFVEIRVPSDDPDIAAAAARGTDLRNGNVYHGMGGGMTTGLDGDYAVLKSRHLMAYRTEDRSIELWLGHSRLLVFNLMLPAKPPEQSEFSDWKRVDHVRPNFYGEEIQSDDGHDFWIRTRVRWEK